MRHFPKFWYRQACLNIVFVTRKILLRIKFIFHTQSICVILRNVLTSMCPQFLILKVWILFVITLGEELREIYKCWDRMTWDWHTFDLENWSSGTPEEQRLFVKKWVCVLVLIPVSCVTCGKPLSFSELQFLPGVEWGPWGGIVMIK